MTKGLGAFVAGGAGAGALDTGTIAANTWYHVHAIKHGTTGEETEHDTATAADTQPRTD